MNYTTIVVGLDNSDNIIVSMFKSKTYFDAPPYVEQETKIFKHRLQLMDYIERQQEEPHNTIRVQDFTCTPPTNYYRTSKERYLNGNR